MVLSRIPMFSVLSHGSSLLLKRSEQSELVGLIAGTQRQLYAYILTLLADRNQADDVLQETNLVLWEKADEYTPGTSFMAWATRVAYFQVMAHFKRNKRDRLRLSDTVIEEVAQLAARQQPLLDIRCRAMHDCVAKLTEEDRDLIHRRYMGDQKADVIAGQVGRTAAAVRQALYRIRSGLLRCIEKTLSRASG